MLVHLKNKTNQGNGIVNTVPITRKLKGNAAENALLRSKNFFRNNLKMPERYLNIEYSGIRTEIDVTAMEDLSEVRRAIKAELANNLADVDAPLLQLYDQQRQLITDLDDIPEDYYKKPKHGGLFLVIRTSPPPTRESSRNDLFVAGSTSFLSAEEDLSRKRQRFELSDLTTQLKSFASSRLVEGCIQSQDQELFPYLQDEIKKLYVRKCYQDVFDLLLEQIKGGRKSFAISGTPGIGKSLFFVYILYRLMDDFRTKTLSLKPKRIVYHCVDERTWFDLEKQTVVELGQSDARALLRKQDTLYIVDGRTTPSSSTCITLFISSPRSEWYKEFVKQKTAKEWYFPVWTLAELQACQRHCYPALPIQLLQERHRICGGVARFVFHNDYSVPVPKKMLSALNDVHAVRGVRYVGQTTDIFPESHTLLQILVGDDDFGNAYQFTDLDVVSEYVGKQLWIRYSAPMITNLKEMFGGSPNEISRHLFEIYGHLVFSVGGRTLKCRCLESGTVTDFTLDALHSQRITFGKDTIPTAEDLSGKYYEPTDDDSFPAIDSFSPQGMFQFTVAAEHPIRGVQILQRLCALYDEPKLYFVVPPHRFAAFKKQSFKAKTGTDDVTEIYPLKQYVLELPVRQHTR
jgi:hypothetical protein